MNKLSTGVRRRNYQNVNQSEPPPSESDAMPSEVELTDRQIRELKREARKRKWVRRFTMCSNYVHGLFWVSMAILVIWYTNFFVTVWEDHNVN